MKNMIKICESYERPSFKYPYGSYMRSVGENVEIATGRFALEHPNKPSPYWHGGAPFVMIDMPNKYPWERR